MSNFFSRTYLHCCIICRGGGRYVYLKRVMGMCSGKDLLYTLPQLSVPQDPHAKIWLNFQFLSLKIGQYPVQEALFGPKVSSESKKLKKISSASPQIWHQSLLQAPIVGPLGCSPIPKLKLSTHLESASTQDSGLAEIVSDKWTRKKSCLHFNGVVGKQ